MISYIFRRFIYMILLLLLLSIVSFITIQLPTGDYVTSYLTKARVATVNQTTASEAEIAALRKEYGLDQPVLVQYFVWMRNIFHGNLGRSFAMNKPVKDLLAERLPLTVLVSMLTLLLTYLIAIPIGIYSATHQYSLGDYFFTFIGYIGLATPSFLLALVLILLFNRYFGLSIGGLFSANYVNAAWSFKKIIDLLKHLPIPLLVISTAGTAGIIRVMRGCLLDELRKPYVITARAKGVKESTLLLKYPLRIAINPIISTIGWILPSIFSGEVIVAIVLNLPTTGPLLLQALLQQDVYLSGTIILILGFLTILGTFISDMLLVLADPRIYLEKRS